MCLWSFVRLRDGFLKFFYVLNISWTESFQSHLIFFHFDLSISVIFWHVVLSWVKSQDLRELLGWVRSFPKSKRESFSSLHSSRCHPSTIFEKFPPRFGEFRQRLFCVSSPLSPRLSTTVLFSPERGNIVGMVVKITGDKLRVGGQARARGSTDWAQDRRPLIATLTPIFYIFLEIYEVGRYQFWLMKAKEWHYLRAASRVRFFDVLRLGDTSPCNVNRFFRRKESFSVERRLKTRSKWGVRKLSDATKHVGINCVKYLSLSRKLWNDISWELFSKLFKKNRTIPPGG